MIIISLIQQCPSFLFPWLRFDPKTTIGGHYEGFFTQLHRHVRSRATLKIQLTEQLEYQYFGLQQSESARDAYPRSQTER